MKNHIILIFVLLCVVGFAYCEDVSINTNDSLFVYKYLFGRNSLFPRIGANVIYPEKDGDFEAPSGIVTIKANDYPEDMSGFKNDDGLSVDSIMQYFSTVPTGPVLLPMICILLFILWLSTLFCCCCCCHCGCTSKEMKLKQPKKKIPTEKLEKRQAKAIKKFTKKRRNTTICMNFVSCCLCTGSAMFFLASLSFVGIASKTLLGRGDEIGTIIDNYMTEDNNLPTKIDQIASTDLNQETYTEFADRYSTVDDTEKLVVSGLLGKRSAIYKYCSANSFPSDCCVSESDFKLFYILDYIRSMVESDVPANEEVSEISDIVPYFMAETSAIITAVDDQIALLSTCSDTDFSTEVLSKPIISDFDSRIVNRMISAIDEVGFGTLITDVINSFNAVFDEFDTQFAPIMSTITSTLQSIINMTDSAGDLSDSITAVISGPNSTDTKSTINLTSVIENDASLSVFNELIGQVDTLSDLTSQIDDVEADLGMSLSDVIDFAPEDLVFVDILTNAATKLSDQLIGSIFSSLGPLDAEIEDNLFSIQDEILKVNVDNILSDTFKMVDDLFSKDVSGTIPADCYPELVSAGADYTEIEAQVTNILNTAKSAVTCGFDYLVENINEAAWDSGLSDAPSAIYSHPIVANGLKVLGIVPMASSDEEGYKDVDFEVLTNRIGLGLGMVFVIMFGLSCICACCAGWKRSRCCSCCAGCWFTGNFLFIALFALFFGLMNDMMMETCNIVDGFFADMPAFADFFISNGITVTGDDELQKDINDNLNMLSGLEPLTSMTQSMYGATTTIDITFDLGTDLSMSGIFNSFDDPKNLLSSLGLVYTFNAMVDMVYSQLDNSGFIADVISGIFDEQLASVKETFMDSTSDFYGTGSTIDDVVTELDSVVNGSTLSSIRSTLSVDPATISSLVDATSTIFSTLQGLNGDLSLPTSGGDETRCGIQDGGGTYKSNFSGLSDAIISAYIQKFYDNPAGIYDSNANLTDTCNAVMFVGSASSLVTINLKDIKDALSGANAEFVALMLTTMINLDDNNADTFRTWCDTNDTTKCNLSAFELWCVDGSGCVTLNDVDPSDYVTELNNILLAGITDTDTLALPQTVMSLSATLNLLNSLDTDLNTLTTSIEDIVSLLDPTVTAVEDLIDNMTTVFTASTFTTIADQIDTSFDSLASTLETNVNTLISGATSTLSQIVGEDLSMLRTDITSYMYNVLTAPICSADFAHPGLMSFIGYLSLGFFFILIGTCCGICASCRGVHYFRRLPTEKGKGKGDSDNKKRGRHGSISSAMSDTHSQYDSVYSTDISYSEYSDYSSEGSPRRHDRTGGRPLMAGADDLQNAFYLNT